MKRIKKLSQKLQDGSFSVPFPIGADALNIDMLSGSSLEEEMHLGSPSTTSFSTDENNQMIIIEKYKKDSQTEYYTMKTIFKTENEEMTIIQELSFGTAEAQGLKRKKTITFITKADNSLEIKEAIS